MRLGLALCCFLMLMNAAAVRAQDVAVDFDKRVDFSRFKTYSWTSGVPTKNPFVNEKIRFIIEEHLAAKGLRRLEEGGDLSVLYLAAIDRDLEFATGSWLTTGDWMRPTTSGISVRSQVWDVEVGTLVVCLSDPANKNLLWRGAAKTRLDKRSSNKDAMVALEADARKIEKKIKKAVAKMFKQYPLAKSA